MDSSTIRELTMQPANTIVYNKAIRESVEIARQILDVSSPLLRSAFLLYSVDASLIRVTESIGAPKIVSAVGVAVIKVKFCI